MRDRGWTIVRGARVLGAVAVLVALSGCDDNAKGSASTSSTSVAVGGAPGSPAKSSDALAVPGIPDPCALIPPDTVLAMAHIEDSAKVGSVPSPSGGRACGYNMGRPDELQISLTPVSKAGFDAYRQLAQGKLTDLKDVGQEAYSSSDAPGVVDVFKNEFDLNIWVTHAMDSTQAASDAKTLATALAAKI